MDNKNFSDKNRTLRILETEEKKFADKLISINSKVTKDEIEDKIINQNYFEIAEFLPEKFVDLLIIDPPDNLSKTFNTNKFSKLSSVSRKKVSSKNFKSNWYT